MTIRLMHGAAVLALISAAALTLTACDGGPSAVRMASGSGAADTAPVSKVDHRQDSVPLLDGKPMWAANRQHGAEDNARFHFKRDGQAFGADSVEDYVRTAQAFVAAPPVGSEVIKRANGDKLIYDPRGNVFAVATRDGAPRAMFKPKDGEAYWTKQKADAGKQASRRKKDGDGDRSDKADDRQS